MSIQERAKKHAFKTYYTQQGKRIGEESYIAGATEQQALSEARIKQLETDLHKYKSLYDELDANQEPLEDKVILSEARIKELEEALKVIKMTWPLSETATSVINKALNNQQQ